jgi:hypothetical protein
MDFLEYSTFKILEIHKLNLVYYFLTKSTSKNSIGFSLLEKKSYTVCHHKSNLLNGTNILKNARIDNNVNRQLAYKKKAN